MGQSDNWHMIDPYAITWMYNLWVRQNAMYEHEELYTDHGESDEEYVTDVLVDICARYIVLFSNEGNEKKVQLMTPLNSWNSWVWSETSATRTSSTTPTLLLQIDPVYYFDF